MNIHKPTIHTEEETHGHTQANNTYRGRDELRHTYEQDTYRMKRRMNMHKPTIHTEEETREYIQTNKTHTEEETQEHTQANNTYRGRYT